MCGYDYHRKGIHLIQCFDGHFIFDKNPFGYFQAVFTVNKEEGLTLIEIAEDVTIEDILTSTGCEFQVSPDLKKLEQIAS